MIYRCGCCMLSATAKYKVAWCHRHNMYECQSCWEHAHPNETEYTWGEDDEPETDDHPRRP